MAKIDPPHPFYLSWALRVSFGILLALAWPGASLEAQVGVLGTGVRFRFEGVLSPMRFVREGQTLWSDFPDPLRQSSLFSESLRRSITRARERRWRDLAVRPESDIGSDPVLPDPEPAPSLPPSPVQVPRFRSADLNVELAARLESQLDRLRNLNCTIEDLSNPSSGCQGGFPTPSVMQEFQLRAGGVIAERLNVDVDFDSKREFSSSNTIKVWYQGREDEILQRLEVGNLDFQLPESRFIRSAVPANAFGFQSEAQFGPVLMRTILAQEKGSAVRARVFNIGDDATQEISRENRDTEFEAGRFFSVVHPARLPNYPDVDVLNIDPTGLSLDLQVVQVRVFRLQAQSGRAGRSSGLQGINAVAIRDDSPQRIGPFFWDLLIEGRDYYLDPSGLWFGLNRRVSTDEFLAVSYITALGDTVGTFPSVSGGADTLFLVHEPRRGPEVPTFFHELRNFYRIGGQVERNSIDLSIVVNESERPLDGVGTYLSRLGVATVTDIGTLDEFNRVFPRDRDPRGGEPIDDLFLVFPHFTPFADSARFQSEERNDSLYLTPTYLRSTEGAAVRFRLLWNYQATGTGDRARVNLGVVQVVEGSEKIRVGSRDLVRGRDYDISYDLGNITFRNPDSLFSGPTQVHVQFEENQLFDVAPSNVAGLQATYDLSSYGRIDAMAIFRSESSIFTRPRLGFEPEALFMGGISSVLQFRPAWLTDALDRLPLFSTNVPSVLSFSGEVAVSRPDPSQNRQAYVEEFESRSSRTIALAANRFQLGSMPSSGAALPPSHVGPAGDFVSGNAATVVWQNQIDLAGQPFTVAPGEIDSSIVLTGSLRPVETLLWMTLKPSVEGMPDPITGQPRWTALRDPGPRWGSVTQPLDESGLGVDLSRVEFLEFWLLEDLRAGAVAQRPVLVFDFGSVFEDAEAFGPTSFRVTGADTTYSGKQRLGAGVLDSEKDPFSNVFNASVN
ncbi:MAG: cell surface protein SprA, partial [Gemmatimonadota bacterium]|nr:cell surface protein SprA [Gemmatimonadota bacterium]